MTEVISTYEPEAEIGRDQQPEAEMLVLTEEGRAELDDAFENVVEGLDAAMPPAEKDAYALTPGDKTQGAYEPGYKKPS
jgi:hypothetical protein